MAPRRKALMMRASNDEDSELPKRPEPQLPQTQFLDMPDLVLDIIVKMLPLEEKKALRVTCWRMADFVTPFVTLIPTLNDSTAQQVLNSYYWFNTLNITDLRLPHAIPARGIDFGDRISSLTMNNNADNGQSISSLNFIRILRSCSNIANLTLSGKAIGSMNVARSNFISTIRLDNLQKLEIIFEGSSPRGAFLQALSLATFPSLHTLKIAIKNLQLKLFCREYNWITRLIAEHHASLKILVIDDAGQLPRFWSDLTTDVFWESSLSTFDLLPRVQLDVFEFCNFPVFPTIWLPSNWFGLSYLLKEQRSLKRFSIHYPTANLVDPINTLLRLSAPTLDSAIFVQHQNASQSFHCAILEPCNHLTTLYISSHVGLTNVSQLPQSINTMFWNAPIKTEDVAEIRNRLVNLRALHLGRNTSFPTEETLWNIITLPRLRALYICTTNAILVSRIQTTVAAHSQEVSVTLRSPTSFFVNTLLIVEQ